MLLLATSLLAGPLASPPLHALLHRAGPVVSHQHQGEAQRVYLSRALGTENDAAQAKGRWVCRIVYFLQCLCCASPRGLGHYSIMSKWSRALLF